MGTDMALLVTDLWTFTLNDGTVFRVTSGDQDVTLTYPSFPGDSRTGTVTFSSNVSLYPQPMKDHPYNLKWGMGVQTDEISLALDASPGTLDQGLTLLEALVNGNLDGALAQLERIYSPSPGPVDTSRGTIPLFQGNVSDITEVGREHAVFSLKDRRELLNIPMPFNVYMPGCRWVLYGPGCTLTKSSFGVSGTVATGSGTQKLMVSGPTNPSGYFAQGTLKFTSGVNSGLEVPVRAFTAGSPNTVLLYTPLVNAPATGDACTLFPGCDKSMNTCLNKFNNLINFGGTPFTPVPESAV
jgi:hypothetical protein